MSSFSCMHCINKCIHLSMVDFKSYTEDSAYDLPSLEIRKTPVGFRLLGSPLAKTPGCGSSYVPVRNCSLWLRQRAGRLPECQPKSGMLQSSFTTYFDLRLSYALASMTCDEELPALPVSRHLPERSLFRDPHTVLPA